MHSTYFDIKKDSSLRSLMYINHHLLNLYLCLPFRFSISFLCLHLIVNIYILITILFFPLVYWIILWYGNRYKELSVNNALSDL